MCLVTGDVRQAATFERGRRDSRPAIAKLHFPTNSISASGRVGSRPRQCFFFFIRRPRGRGHFVSRPAGVPLDPRRRCSGPRRSRGPPRRLPLRASPARAAPAAQFLQTNRLGTVARERRRVETTFGIRASRTSASAAVSTSSTSPASPASASTADGSSAHLEVVASPYASPSDVRFEPQIQVGPAVASLAILVAFAVVNRRVAAAVDRRKEREDAEEALRLAKLRSLDGSADFDEVQMFGDALENARAAEAEARQVLAFLGADVRVSVPQPSGNPSRRSRRRSAGSARRSGGEGRRRKQETRRDRRRRDRTRTRTRTRTQTDGMRTKTALRVG